MKNTKGDWFVSGSLEVVAMPTQVKIGRISGANLEEAKANAKLIAAAPDLLNLALFVEEFCEMTQSDKRIFLKKLKNLSDKAIAKATK